MSLNIINFLSNLEDNSKFLFIIIGIIVLLLILIFIFNYLSNRQVKKQEKFIKKNRKRLIDEINQEAKNIVPNKKEPLKVVQKKEVLSNIKSFDNEDIEVLEDEVIEVIDDNNDVDRILNDIKKAAKDDNFNLTEFEREQEETAIISYDELCKRAGVQKKIYKKTNDEVTKKIENHTEKKYKPSKYVSPIYGIQKEDDDEEDLDKTFLQSLKEFRSTLD